MKKTIPETGIHHPRAGGLSRFPLSRSVSWAADLPPRPLRDFDFCRRTESFPRFVFREPTPASESYRSNSLGKLGSTSVPCCLSCLAIVRAPFSRKCFSRTTAFRVLHLYAASATSPTNGISPMKKSIIILIIICVRSRAGSPPSIPSQVFNTINANMASAASPMLGCG